MLTSPLPRTLPFKPALFCVAPETGKGTTAAQLGQVQPEEDGASVSPLTHNCVDSAP